MDDPPKTVRRTLPIGRAEERVVERGTKPDQTGPARPLVLEDRTEIRGAKRGQGGRGAGWPKKSSKSLRTPGRTKDRRRFSCPSLNHSLPLGSTRPFSTSVGPFVLPSPCLCRCFFPTFVRFVLLVLLANHCPARVSVWPNARTCVRRRGHAMVPERTREGTGEEDGTDLKQHGWQSQIPKRQGKKECVGLKREQSERRGQRGSNGDESAGLFRFATVRWRFRANALFCRRCFAFPWSCDLFSYIRTFCGNCYWVAEVGQPREEESSNDFFFSFYNILGTHSPSTRTISAKITTINDADNDKED